MIKPIIGIGSDILSQDGERDRAFAFDTYIQSLRRAGAVPVVIPPQAENAPDAVEGLDGILLAGGNDCDPAAYGEEPHPSVEPMDRRRQESDSTLARAARERGVPTLGICLGLQIMNIAAGGTLIQDIDSQVGTSINHVSPADERIRHEVAIEPGTGLAGILSGRKISVNSSHHQAIKDVGAGLRVTARAADGIIEGLEDPGHPFYAGVQWHPEDMAGEPSADELFGAFVEAARRHALRRRSRSTEMSPAAAAATE